MLIAIDHGNYAIKTPHFSFVAGLTEHTTLPPMEDEVLKYGSTFWTLSGNRIPYMRDKTNDERYFVLTLFAIARELELAGCDDGFEQVDLAVGLPPEHFGILQTKFAQYFKRDEPVTFLFKSKRCKIVIRNVFVYPQAYAAIAPEAAKLISSVRTFVVDIGGYTTDVLLLRNGKPDLQFCRSLEMGVITMNNDIIRKVSSQYDLTLNDELIAAVLMGQNTILPEEVKDIIRHAARQHANDILNKLRELQVDLRSNPAVFIGGGSILFQEYLSSSRQVMQAEFNPDSKANANGYLMLANVQLAAKGQG